MQTRKDLAMTGHGVAVVFHQPRTAVFQHAGQCLVAQSSTDGSSMERRLVLVRTLSLAIRQRNCRQRLVSRLDYECDWKWRRKWWGASILMWRKHDRMKWMNSLKCTEQTPAISEKSFIESRRSKSSAPFQCLTLPFGCNSYFWPNVLKNNEAEKVTKVSLLAQHFLGGNFRIIPAASVVQDDRKVDAVITKRGEVNSRP
jgi:hypothetical protein